MSGNTNTKPDPVKKVLPSKRKIIHDDDSDADCVEVVLPNTKPSQ